MTEQELADKLAEATDEYRIARKRLAEIKKRYNEAENLVIEAKIKWENITEQLQMYRDAMPDPGMSLHDQEIERFRGTYPEVCVFAKERDEQHGKE